MVEKDNRQSIRPVRRLFEKFILNSECTWMILAKYIELLAACSVYVFRYAVCFLLFLRPRRELPKETPMEGCEAENFYE
jgi:hypothetical protein